MPTEKHLRGSQTLPAQTVDKHLTKKRPEYHKQRKRTAPETWDLFQQSNGKQIPEEILGLTKPKRTEINRFAAHGNTGPGRPPAVNFSVLAWKHRYIKVIDD